MKNKLKGWMWLVASFGAGITASKISNLLVSNRKADGIIGACAFVYAIYLYYLSETKDFDRMFQEVGKHVISIFVSVAYIMFVCWLTSLTGLQGISAVVVGLCIFSVILIIFCIMLIPKRPKDKKPGSD